MAHIRPSQVVAKLLAVSRSYMFTVYAMVCRRNGDVFQHVGMGELLDFIKSLKWTDEDVSWLKPRLNNPPIGIEDREALIAAAWNDSGEETGSLIFTGLLRPTGPGTELRFGIEHESTFRWLESLIES